MEQKTAVEWLFMTLALTPMTDWYNVLQQAKAMEKEQIQNAFVDGEGGYNPDDGNIERMADDYYNKTYNK